MIPRRYVWLLRDETTLYETFGPFGGTCKLCSALERPEGLQVLPRRAQARHLAAHRAERITNDVDPEADVIAAAIEKDVTTVTTNTETAREDAAREAARRLFANDDCEIDADAAVSYLDEPGTGVEGFVWVACWRLVPADEIGGSDVPA